MPVPSLCTSKEGESFHCFTGRCRIFNRWQLFPTISISGAAGHPHIGVSALCTLAKHTEDPSYVPKSGTGDECPVPDPPCCLSFVKSPALGVPFSSFFQVLSALK